MIHVGNDIVDLKAPVAIGKSTDHRFVNRVLTENEQKALNTASNPDTLLWFFWAAKETAFKAVSKYSPTITFSPASYSVTIDSAETGQKRGVVSTPSGSVHVTFLSDDDKVSCLGISDSQDFNRVTSGIGKLSDQEAVSYDVSSDQVSSIVRKHAIRSIAGYFDLPIQYFSIVRHNGNSGYPGPPVVLFKSKPLQISLSLSHDGRFFSYAWRCLADTL